MGKIPADKDWATSGKPLGNVVLQHGLMVDEPYGGRVRVLRWGGAFVQLVDTVVCAPEGTFELEFLTDPPATRAAVDVRPVGGAVILPDGQTVECLRTWHQNGLSNPVRYRYTAPDAKLHVSTGYEQETQPGHNVFVTRSSWAGFRVDRPGRNERIYHGALGPDGDFEALVFRIRLL